MFRSIRETIAFVGLWRIIRTSRGRSRAIRSLLYNAGWRSQFPALGQYLVNHPDEWQALNGEYWSNGPAETELGDYDDQHQWRDAYWWHQNDPARFYDNHMSWAALDSRWLDEDGAYDQQRQWHYGEWWYNQNPTWVTTNHPNWLRQHHSWERPGEQQTYRQQHAMIEQNQQQRNLHQQQATQQQNQRDWHQTQRRARWNSGKRTCNSNRACARKITGSSRQIDSSSKPTANKREWRNSTISSSKRTSGSHCIGKRIRFRSMNRTIQVGSMGMATTEHSKSDSHPIGDITNGGNRVEIAGMRRRTGIIPLKRAVLVAAVAMFAAEELRVPPAAAGAARAAGEPIVLSWSSRLSGVLSVLPARKVPSDRPAHRAM